MSVSSSAFRYFLFFQRKFSPPEMALRHFRRLHFAFDIFRRQTAAFPPFAPPTRSRYVFAESTFDFEAFDIFASFHRSQTLISSFSFLLSLSSPSSPFSFAVSPSRRRLFDAFDFATLRRWTHDRIARFSIFRSGFQFSDIFRRGPPFLRNELDSSFHGIEASLSLDTGQFSPEFSERRRRFRGFRYCQLRRQARR